MRSRVRDPIFVGCAPRADGAPFTLLLNLLEVHGGSIGGAF
jgi:hypothetical protein